MNEKRITNYEKRKAGYESIIAVFLVLFWCFCLLNLVKGQTSVQVFAENQTKNESLTLGDISKISARNSMTEKRFREIPLGFVPAFGSTGEIFKDKILLAIFAAGFKRNEFVFDCPPKVLVRRITQEVDRELFYKAIEKRLLQAFAQKNPTIKILRLDLPQNLQIPSGSFEIFAQTQSVTNFFYPFTASFEIRLDGKTVRRFSTTVQIEATAEILVAVKDLVSKSKITSADVKKEVRILTKPLNKYLFEAEDLTGKFLTKNVLAGEELTSESLFSGYVVRAGDIVRVIGESANLQLSISAEAKSSGKIGDRIAVKNNQSGVILQAVVVSEGLVKIKF